MKTTLDIQDSLLANANANANANADAKAAVALQRTTLTRLIEEGLKMRLRNVTLPASKTKPVVLVFHGKGGLAGGLTGRSNREMLAAADENDAGR